MAGTIAGKVVDIRNNAPIEGAAVDVEPGGHKTSTGDDGRYSVSLDAGSYNMNVSKDGYDPWVAEGIVVLDEVTTEINVALWPQED